VIAFAAEGVDITDQRVQVNTSLSTQHVFIDCEKPCDATAAVPCHREVFFETNGVPRTVEVVDTTDQTEGGGSVRKAAREKADPDVLGSVGAPMAGEVIEVTAKPGRRLICLSVCLSVWLAV